MGVVANTDGSVTVTFDLDESGGSGLSSAKIVAVREGSTAPADQRAVLDAATLGTSVVASSNLAASPGSRQVYNFSAGQLDYYTKYLFYIACQDSQGWFNAPPGSVTTVNSPGLVTGTAIGNNGERVYDPSPPTINVSDVRATPDGKLRVVYSMEETGNSMLNAARLAASTAAMTRVQVLAATSTSVSVTVPNTTQVDVESQVAVIDGLSGWTSYKVYFAAQDKQLWFDNGLFSGGDARWRDIVNNRGRTWDNSPLPEVTISTATMSLTSSNTLTVTAFVKDVGLSGINRASILVRESGGANTSISQYEIIFGTTGGEREILLSNTTSGFQNTVTKTITALRQFTQYHVYAAIIDNQGNYNGSAATAHATTFEPVSNPMNVTGHVIPNSGRTYDLTAPSLNANPSMSMSGGTAVMIQWSGASDSMSGLNRVKLFVTTDSGLVPAATIASAGNSGGTQRVETSTAESGQVTISGIQTGATVYGWVVAVDNAGNVSEARRTSPTFITLDGQAPTVSWVSGEQTGNTTASVTIRVTDNMTGVASGTIFVRRNGTSTNDYSISIVPINGDKTFAISNLQSYTAYNVIVTAIDGAGNVCGETTVKTFTSWDTTAPSIGTYTLTNTGTTANISFTVSDTGTGLGSIAATGSVSGSQTLSGNLSQSGTLTTTALNYGSNTVTLTVSDKAGSQSSYLNSKTTGNNILSMSRDITVTRPAPVSQIYSITGDANGPSGTARIIFRYRFTAASGNLSKVNFFPQGSDQNGALTSPISNRSDSGEETYNYNTNTRLSSYNGNFMTAYTDPSSGTAGSTLIDVPITYPAPRFISYSITGDVYNGFTRIIFAYDVIADSFNLSRLSFFASGSVRQTLNVSGNRSSGTVYWEVNSKLSSIGNCSIQVETANPNSGTVSTSPVIDVVIQYPPDINLFQLSSSTAATLKYEWNVGDLNSNLNRIQFYIDDVHQSSENLTISGNSSVSSKEIAATAGSRRGFIRVFDGNTFTESETSTVTVAAANVAPVINSFNVTASSTRDKKVLLEWNVSDTNSNITKIELFLDNASLSPVTTFAPPVERSISNREIAVGSYKSYTCKIVVTDSASASATLENTVSVDYLLPESLPRGVLAYSDIDYNREQFGTASKSLAENETEIKRIMKTYSAPYDDAAITQQLVLANNQTNRKDFYDPIRGLLGYHLMHWSQRFNTSNFTFAIENDNRITARYTTSSTSSVPNATYILSGNDTNEFNMYNAFWLPDANGKAKNQSSLKNTPGNYDLNGIPVTKVRNGVYDTNNGGNPPTRFYMQPVSPEDYPQITSFTFTSPNSNALKFDWTVTDSNSNLSSIYFFIKGIEQTFVQSIQGSSSTGEKTFTNIPAASDYYGQIKVLDSTNLVSVSSIVQNVSVTATNRAPTISSFTLTGGAGIITYGWSVADADSNLSIVELFVVGQTTRIGAQSISFPGNASTSSKSVTISAGTYSGYIKVSDSADQVVTSTTSTVVVSQATSAPVISSFSLFSPPSSSESTGDLKFEWKIEDSNSNLDKIEFFINGVKEGSSLLVPAGNSGTFESSRVFAKTPGTYRGYIIVTDNTSLQTQSAEVTGILVTRFVPSQLAPVFANSSITGDSSGTGFTGRIKFVYQVTGTNLSSIKFYSGGVERSSTSISGTSAQGEYVYNLNAQTVSVSDNYMYAFSGIVSAGFPSGAPITVTIQYPPKIESFSMSSPSPGEKLQFNWKITDVNSDINKLEFYINNEISFFYGSAFFSNSGNLSENSCTLDKAPGTYNCRIKAFDIANNVTESATLSQTVTAVPVIVIPAPTFTTLSITGNSDLQGRLFDTGQIVFTCRVAASGSNLQKVEFYYSDALKNTTTISGSSADVSYTFDTNAYSVSHPNNFIRVYTTDQMTETAKQTITVDYRPKINSFNAMSPLRGQIKLEWSVSDLNSNLTTIDTYLNDVLKENISFVSSPSSTSSRQYAVAHGTYKARIVCTDATGLTASQTVINIIVQEVTTIKNAFNNGHLSNVNLNTIYQRDASTNLFYHIYRVMKGSIATMGLVQDVQSPAASRKRHSGFIERFTSIASANIIVSNISNNHMRVEQGNGTDQWDENYPVKSDGLDWDARIYIVGISDWGLLEYAIVGNFSRTSTLRALGFRMINGKPHFQWKDVGGSPDNKETIESLKSLGGGSSFIWNFGF